jgi:hypothetical protein
MRHQLPRPARVHQRRAGRTPSHDGRPTVRDPRAPPSRRRVAPRSIVSRHRSPNNWERRPSGEHQDHSDVSCGRAAALASFTSKFVAARRSLISIVLNAHGHRVGDVSASAKSCARFTMHNLSDAGVIPRDVRGRRERDRGAVRTTPPACRRSRHGPSAR